MSYAQTTLLRALDRTDTARTQASDRIASGKKINSAIDDPIMFNRITETKASVSTTAIKLSILDEGMDRVDARDSTLNSMQEALQRFQELTTKASTGMYKTQDILPELKALKDSMLSLSNTADSRGLMFAGSSLNTPFAADAAGNVTYAGNTTPNIIDIEGVKMSGSVDGTPILQAFAAMTNVINTMNGGANPSIAQVTSVAGAVETLGQMRTDSAAQAAAANMIKTSLEARTDREGQSIENMESADIVAETLKFTESGNHYDDILKITGTELNRKRLLDYL